MDLNILLENVHVGLPLPGGDVEHVSLVRGLYKYYHYLCDGLDDRGWGCGYRTLQTLCSWILLEKKEEGKCVPSIWEIQKCLVDLGDKPESFQRSREWIGSIEVGLCIDYFFGVPCKILHMQSGKEIKNYIPALESHFDAIGSPAMMGGDKDASSKGILGVCRTSSNIYLLVLDPHYHGKRCSIKYLQENGWVKWQPLESFLNSSFYNVCLPQMKK